MAEKNKYVEFEHKFFDRWIQQDVELKFNFARPTPQQSARVQKQALKDAGQAFRNLCLDTVKPEERQELIAALGKYAGLSSTFGGALMASCGFGELGN